MSDRRAVLVLDEDGRVASWSPAATELLGYEAPEIVGRDAGVLAASSRGHELELAREIARAITEGRAEGELELRRKDGSTFRARALTLPLVGTSRRQVVRILSEADGEGRPDLPAAPWQPHDLVQMVVEGLPIGIVVVDLAGRIEYASPRALEYFGRPLEGTVEGPAAEQIIHPEDFERAISAWLAARSGERPFEVEGVRLRRRDGSYRSHLARGFPVKDRSGRVTHWVVSGIDLHRLRQASEAARENEELFRTLGETVPVLLWMSDAAGTTLYRNPAFNAYIGSNGSPLADRSSETLAHPDDVGRLRQLWAQAGERGAAFELEYRLRRKDGAFRWFLARVAPVRDAQGQLSRWVGTLTDIDETKRALDALRAADEHKDAFLAMLGHELRNPLGPIRNAAQIVSMVGSPEPTAARALEIIDRQVGHMSRLIDDLLDVSRIVAGRLELRRERSDLAAIVQQTVDAYRPSLESAGLRLSTEIATGPIVVEVDRSRISQVVGNLLHNARKFTPPGGSVTVRLAARPDGKRAALTVADSGIGMDPALLQRAFDVFSQADRSLERASGGLGLGLALVKGLVDLHGGDVRATSPGPRKGAVVTVELPVLAGALEAEAALGQGAGPTRLRVLVIEDNVDAAESLQTMLRLAGHEVQTALSGTSGVAVAERYRPDVILCDIGLPGMNGYEVARALRQSQGTAGVHLVALTGYGQDEDRRRGREAGFDDYLTKPADFGTLQSVMTRQRRTA